MKRISAQRYTFAFLLPMVVFGTATVRAGAQNADFKGFPDVPKSHWAYQAVTELAQKGILQGYPAEKHVCDYHSDSPMVSRVYLRSIGRRGALPHRLLMRQKQRLRKGAR